MVMNLSIVGAGYVGLSTGVCFADKGHKINFIDIDSKKVDQLNNGIPPIYEEGLKELLTKNKERIRATTDYTIGINSSSVTFLCVGTPPKDDGSIDLSFITTAIKKLAKILEKDHILVVKSTVVPGTTRDILIPLLEKESGKKAGKDFSVVMNPEFLREGKAIYDFMHPDRIILGVEDPSGEQVLKELYEPFHSQILKTKITEAEMIKYASNALLATKISFANEIGNLCKKIGIDVNKVMKGVGLDSRISPHFLGAGIGFGGSCFPKDVQALISWAKQNKTQTFLLESVIKINDNQPLILVHLLEKYFPNLEGKKIGILGLSFKPETDDIRETRSLPIVEYLLKKGADILAYDPKAIANFQRIYPQLHYCISAHEVLEADAILILTKWDEFKKLDYSGKTVIDGRNLEEAKKARIYEGICW